MLRSRFFRMVVCLLVVFSLQGLRLCDRPAADTLTDGAYPAAQLRLSGGTAALAPGNEPAGAKVVEV